MRRFGANPESVMAFDRALTAASAVFVFVGYANANRDMWSTMTCKYFADVGLASVPTTIVSMAQSSLGSDGVSNG